MAVDTLVLLVTLGIGWKHTAPAYHLLRNIADRLSLFILRHVQIRKMPAGAKNILKLPGVADFLQKG